MGITGVAGITVICYLLALCIKPFVKSKCTKKQKYFL